jgi:hypothetical protein
MTYTVMLRCATGTWALWQNPLEWRALSHVITWSWHDSRAEAEAMRDDLNAGGVRGTRAWIEEER